MVAAPGAVGESMCERYVLRGGSCVTYRSQILATDRNFFPDPRERRHNTAIFPT